MAWRDLLHRAADRHWVVTYEDADACDVPRSTLHLRVRAEQWTTLFPGVFVPPGHEVTGRTLLAAALAWAGDRAAVGGEAALWLHGIVPRLPEEVRVWVPPSCRDFRREANGCRIRRNSRLKAADVVEVDGLRTVTPAQAIFDEARRELGWLRNVAIDGRHRGVLDLARLGTLVDRHPTVAGRATLRQVLEDLTEDDSDSGFEHRVRARLIDLGLPPADEQAVVLTAAGTRRRIDVPYLPEHVGIECIGFAYHHTRRQLDQDALRHNEIAELDRWLVLHLTWSMLFDGWPSFVDTLRGALARRR